MELATARIGDVPVRVRDVWNAQTCPEGLLPWLAWAYSVDDWEETWTAEQKRATIQKSVEVHRYKGTIGAVREALAALGYGAQVQEWFNQVPTGAPYTYRLLLESAQAGINQAALEKILRIVETNKNLRSHMSEAVPSVVTNSTVCLAGVNLSGHEVTVKDGNPRYADGSVAWDLIYDEIQHGGTVQAINQLTEILRVKMPANAWSA